MIIKGNSIIVDLNDYKKKFRKLKSKKYRDYKIIEDENSNFNEEAKAFIKAFNIKDDKERYSYIYDFMCKYLDSNVCVMCDFKNDKCIANRLKKSVHEKDGCCYFSHEGFCKLFDYEKKICTNPNISCKMFMCKVAEDKLGYQSLSKNYLLLNFFFNRRQRDVIQRNYRKSKENTIDLLLKKK